MKLKALAMVGVMALAGMVTSGDAFATVSCPAGALRDEADTLAECNLPEQTGPTLMETVQTIINVIIGVIGVVAVVVIILGGIYYVISQGEAAKITRAKNTILYGIVGLVISLLAFAIVNFVMTSVFSSSSAGGGSGSGSGDSSTTTTTTPSPSPSPTRPGVTMEPF